MFPALGGLAEQKKLPGSKPPDWVLLWASHTFGQGQMSYLPRLALPGKGPPVLAVSAGSCSTWAMNLKICPNVSCSDKLNPNSDP